MNDVPTGLAHIDMNIRLGEHMREQSAEHLVKYEHELKVLGTALSIIYQFATCHRKCFGGPHTIEAIAARVYNLAWSSYILICRGFYDEALNLVRSIGEIANLLGLFYAIPATAADWSKANKSARRRKFSPAKVRQILEKENSALVYASKDWYSDFCEMYVHVHPHTKPNSYNEFQQGIVGAAYVQEDGLNKSIDELVHVCLYIALIVSSNSELDDLRQQLLYEYDNRDIDS